MSELDERDVPDEEIGYGAAIEGDVDDAPDQDQPQTREPPSEEEAEQDNYANPDDQES
jgi:hypothetical protein